MMAKSKALLRAQTKLKKLHKEVKTTEKRIKTLVAKEEKEKLASKKKSVGKRKNKEKTKIQVKEKKKVGRKKKASSAARRKVRKAPNAENVPSGE